MKLLSAIANGLDGKTFLGGRYRLVRRKSVEANFDAAERGGLLQNHWRTANNLDPVSEATPEILRIVRARVRHEFNNNSYCKGIVNTVANYVIGTGPKLRLIPRGKVSQADRRRLYEYANLFNDWFWEIQGARKLRVIYCAKIKDGEGFASIGNRSKGKIRLTIKPFECDLVTHNDFNHDSGKPDGVVLDENDEIKSYKILRHHPGNVGWLTYGEKPRDVDARYVIHVFDETRPGLRRGIPEIATGLKMFAQLSRYSSAVVNSAESAAEISAVLKTQSPPAGGITQTPANSVFELEHNAILTLPGGWELQQLNPTQPGQNHESFLKTIIRDIGRGIDVPYAVAAADASGHNYSSMRGDWQAFYESIKVRRDDMEHNALEKVLEEFNYEARLVYPDHSRLPEYDYYWDWPGYEHVDPLKVANAQKVSLENRTTTLAREYAKQGLFYEDEINQLVYEQELTEKLGTPAPKSEPPVKGDPDDDDQD